MPRLRCVATVCPLLATAVVVGVISAAPTHAAGHLDQPAASAAGPSPGRAATSPLIVLQPGFLGFDKLPLLGAYWGELPERLRAQGFEVVVRAPAPVSAPAARADALVDEVMAMLAPTPERRVIVLAHSQGGVDLRYALARRPDFADRVGAVASLASPHDGSHLVALSHAINDVLPEAVLTTTLGTMHRLWESIEGVPAHEPDVDAALEALDPTRPRPQIDPRIPYFSVGGVTGPDVDHACDGGRWSAPDVLDVVGPQTWVNFMAQQAMMGEHSSDGVVPTASMRFGTFLGCVPADHGDWNGWWSHPLEEELVWAPAPFLVALTLALVDVDRFGPAAMNGHLATLAPLARAHLVRG